MMPRKEFPRKVKAEIIARANGCCEECKAVLKKGEGEVDHILPAELGGENKAANGRLLCKPCHKEKTAGDIRGIRKADRQRDKASGAVRPKGKIKSAGFEKKPRTEKLPLPARKVPLYREIAE